MTRTAIRQAGNAANIDPRLWDSAFMRACRGEPAPRTPVWLMRQAGRYMAEYRAVRQGRDFLELCQKPELACQVTVEALRRIDADAAIIFADILIVLEALGQHLRFAEGHGPVLEPAIRSRNDIAPWIESEAAAGKLDYVAEAIRQTRSELPADCPLIGFAGAPFTLAAYAIEGGGSKQFMATKRLMYSDPACWHEMMARITATLTPYLKSQIAAGAQAVQIFDSWVGILTEADYREFVEPYVADLIDTMPDGIPVILFGTNTDHLLERFLACNPDVIGIDTTTDLNAAWERLGGPERISVQGNLDPTLLLGPRDRLLAGADRVLEAAGNRPGHIFNLGHGVLKETDVEQVVALIDHVHSRSEGA